MNFHPLNFLTFIYFAEFAENPQIFFYTFTLINLINSTFFRLAFTGRKIYHLVGHRPPHHNSDNNKCWVTEDEKPNWPKQFAIFASKECVCAGFLCDQKNFYCIFMCVSLSHIFEVTTFMKFFIYNFYIQSALTVNKINYFLPEERYSERHGREVAAIQWSRPTER